MVTIVRPVVIWNASASISFRKIYEYIRAESTINAERVKEEIIKIIDSLPDHPEKFPPDKFKTNNSGNFRAFEKYSYRIAYKYTLVEIRILRIRHIKQEPKEH